MLETRSLLAFDPSPLEQELLLLVNRMRIDPQTEFNRLIDSITPIHSPDPDINFAIQIFGVDGPTLRSQWNSLTPVAPLAWNEAIYNAAHGHNNAMIAAGQQSHQVPGEGDLGVRLTAAGYNWNAIAENIFCYAETPNFAHGGFAIDWGGGPTGIQSPPGHRINIMNSAYREAGIAIRPFNNGSFGPLVVTQDFGNRFNFGNAFVVGAVWDDANNSGWYNAGEGIAGVTIEFTKAGSPPVLVSGLSAGGFQAQLAPGTYTARAFGGGLTLELVANNVVVGGSNVMLNFVVPDGTAPVANHDRALTVRNTAVVIAVRANDTDIDGNLHSATIEIVSAPSGSQTQINQANGTIAFTPQATFTGGTQLSYRLRDAQGFVSNTATVTIAVVSETAARHNPLKPFDVDFDDLVTPTDIALVINALNAAQTGPLGNYVPGSALLPLFDTTGDNTLAPADAAYIVNHVNAGGGGEAAAEWIAFNALGEENAPREDAISNPIWDGWTWWWLLEEERRAKTSPKPAPVG